MPRSELSTRLLRSRCLVCNQRLVDALSIEIGVGPICRQRIDYDRVAHRIGESERREANEIVRMLVDGTGDPCLKQQIARLRELGFHVYARHLLQHLVVIHIQVVTQADRTLLEVQTPYRAQSLDAWRAIPGRVWDPTTKTNRIPVEYEAQLHALLAEHYGGLVGMDESGAFRVPSLEEPFRFDTERREAKDPETRMLRRLAGFAIEDSAGERKR